MSMHMGMDRQKIDEARSVSASSRDEVDEKVVVVMAVK
jgi:hypothetical protein